MRVGATLTILESLLFQCQEIFYQGNKNFVLEKDNYSLEKRFKVPFGDNQFSSKLAKKIIALGLGILPIQSNFVFPVRGDVQEVSIQQGVTSIDGEAARIYQKGLETQSDGDLSYAQDLFEQVVQVEPTYIDAWNSLGNVLISRGILDQGLLCYKKALSLNPPPNEKWVILLNKASVELALKNYDTALRDLQFAEKFGGAQPSILTNKAVALSMQGDWTTSNQIFEKVISSADRTALPWWLRYSMSLLETNRGAEAIAYLQRTLNRFPDESECLAFGVALYTYMGQREEASRYWKKMSDNDRATFQSEGFISSKLSWGPKSIAAFQDFLSSKYSKI